MEYEAVIGLEVHVQLNTKTKMFTRVPYKYGAEPNTLTNPVVMALPGSLPVLNKEAIRKTVKIGLMFGCEIAQESKWDRKNYFYPDLPKGYQISQLDKPLCKGGAVEIELAGESRNVMGTHRKVRLDRIHLEEDVGKLTHCDGYSLVDYNRAGTPLIEIVTEPDMSSAEEAYAYLNSLRMHLTYAGVSSCDMEKGQMRCDANISVRPVGEKKLGTKVEIKNLNSISNVKAGIEHEIARQIRAIKDGETIHQETRRWNADRCVTTILRGKEGADDYRYFPDPDLMPVRISEEMRAEIGESLPEAPFAKQERFMKELGLPYTVTSVICPDKGLCDFFEAAMAIHKSAKLIANFIANDMMRERAASEDAHGILPLSECKVTPEHIAQLAKLIDEAAISKQIAQDIFPEMFNTGSMPEAIVEAKGLKQTSDLGELEAICQQAIDGNAKAAGEFREGKENAINALKGFVMKETRGKANPKVVDELLRKLLA